MGFGVWNLGFGVWRFKRKINMMRFHMRVGVVGIGFVGRAMLASFRKCGCHDVIAYDKYTPIGKIEDILLADVLFLALPTEIMPDQTYDLSAIHEVCAYLQAHRFAGIVVLKSTVLPGTTERLCREFAGLQLLHNPEFLSAATAERDFHTQRHIVLGVVLGRHDASGPREAFERFRTFYQALYPAATVTVCTSAESEMMKMSCNAFYATKIQFFNEVCALCDHHHINYNRVRDLMLQNDWIHPMHTRVPGHDGRRSFGGACLPKDTAALAASMRAHGTPHRVVRATVDEQATMRADT